MSDTPRFTIARTFGAPRSRVWRAWTDPDALARWFGPKGSSGTVLAFD
ncbi:MAG: SRPBCC domain-containing protein, partial [Methylobacteriaceae bacterium]|nr:SRPBCC domain-containing protein [Methylobacteriaceae bacterium]